MKDLYQLVLSNTKTIGACEKCPFYGGVRLTEVSISRELTVDSNSYIRIRKSIIKARRGSRIIGFLLNYNS